MPDSTDCGGDGRARPFCKSVSVRAFFFFGVVESVRPFLCPLNIK